jgi:hypothetical protein
MIYELDDNLRIFRFVYQNKPFFYCVRGKIASSSLRRDNDGTAIIASPARTCRSGSDCIELHIICSCQKSEPHFITYIRIDRIGLLSFACRNKMTPMMNLELTKKKCLWCKSEIEGTEFHKIELFYTLETHYICNICIDKVSHFVPKPKTGLAHKWAS